MADSSGRRNTGGGCCDGRSAALGSGPAGEAEVAGAAGGGAARGSAAVPGVHRGGSVERGRGDGGGGVAAGRLPPVPCGGRHATVASVAVVEAALGAVPVVRRAGGDRALAGAGPRAAGGGPPPGAGGGDGLGRATAQRRDARWRPGVPGDHRPVARGAVGPPPQAGEARDERRATGLRTGAVGGPCRRPGWGHAPGAGRALEGARRHGPRQNRRWGMAWSPQQIAERLRLDFPDGAAMRISHEAIYQALYVQGRGALRRELTQCLRTGRALRVPRARTRGRGKSFVTPEVLISERPAEAADRAVPGHWEGDLIVGLRGSAIGTPVERTTRFTVLLHLPPMDGHGSEVREKNGPALAGHGAEAVRDAIGRAIITLPRALRRSLTWDQGAEMTQHARLRIDTGLQVYFCDPRSPWQRGTDENTNGLLRQYFPKGTDLSVHGADDLAAVAAALNG